jgi:rare lipoprotein A (peptidoglycan hydrolase)
MKAGNRHPLIVVLCTALALGAAPAHAITGGAAATSPSATPVSGGVAFGAVRAAGATWYGPGFYGNRTACGQVLQPGTIGVAHRSLPCGAAVKFLHNGRALVTRVIDRGPYTAGNAWDLTNGARLALGFEGIGRIRYAVEVRFEQGDQASTGGRSARPRG